MVRVVNTLTCIIKKWARLCLNFQLSSIPLLKDLHNHITPDYAAHWRVIRTLLGLPSGTLDIIKKPGLSVILCWRSGLKWTPC